MSKVTIGMTDGRMYMRYADWIAAYSDELEIVRLGYARNNFEEVEKCQGLVFTGGEDVHPKHYGKPEYLRYCLPADFDEQRDDFELKLLHRAQKRQLPILGICRGLQLVNVYFGGTLIPDIPSWGKFNHAKLPGGGERNHPIRVDPNSQLFGITRSENNVVNSLHHQSADHIGEGLVASAYSPDGVIEALERKDPGADPFLLLVQWHPERMDDRGHPFVKNIAHLFINQVKEYTSIDNYENH